MTLMTPDEQASIVTKYEDLAAGHLRAIQELARVTAQLAFCRNQLYDAVTALLDDEPRTPSPLAKRLRDDRRLRELHEKS